MYKVKDVDEEHHETRYPAHFESCLVCSGCLIECVAKCGLRGVSLVWRAGGDALTYGHQEHKNTDKEKAAEQLCLGGVIDGLMVEETASQESRSEDQHEVDNDRPKDGSLDHDNLAIDKSDTYSLSIDTLPEAYNFTYMLGY